MNKIYIGFDFSINKPAATIYFNNKYYHYFWPLNIPEKHFKDYEQVDVIIKNRNLISISKKDIENSQLVLIHTIRSTDLANLIINYLDEFIKNNVNESNYELYICSEGLSYNSKGDATLNLATYKGVLLSKIYEHYDDKLKRLFTYSPITLKATAGCAGKEYVKNKNKMIEKYMAEINDIKLRIALKNGYFKNKINYIQGIDDIADSYWALKTMLKKEKV